jgi:hypothetical protein
MALTAGQRLTTTNLSQPFVVQAYCSSSLTQSTNTAADIVGATVTFNTVGTNVQALIQGVFDMATTTPAANFALGTCVVDGGAALGAECVLENDTTNYRGTGTQVWLVTLAAAGSHTIKLQGNLTSSAGVCTFNASHTGITVTVFDF